MIDTLITIATITAIYVLVTDEFFRFVVAYSSFILAIMYVIYFVYSLSL